MLPIAVDLAHVRVMLVGDGEQAHRRVRKLDEAGAEALAVYAPSPSAALAVAAGGRLRRRLPTVEEIARAQLVFVAGLPEPMAAEIRRVARIAGVLSNVEDDRGRCDFHSAAVVRRGDLTVAISTNGESPGLAALLRGRIEAQFSAEWSAWLDEIAELRRAWRRSGADSRTVARWTTQWASARFCSERSSPPRLHRQRQRRRPDSHGF